jgi:hypothetical protein
MAKCKECGSQAINHFKAAYKRETEAEGEALEQARLLGMSAERECDLLGKLDRTERKLAVARESMRNTYAMLLGEPRTAQAFMKAEDMLREALAQIGGDK